MNIAELIAEYKDMPHICFNIDYPNKKSVRANNKAVGRMYQIVDTINSKFGKSGVDEFAKLLCYTGETD